MSKNFLSIKIIIEQGYVALRDEKSIKFFDQVVEQLILKSKYQNNFWWIDFNVNVNIDYESKIEALVTHCVVNKLGGYRKDKTGN